MDAITKAKIMVIQVIISKQFNVMLFRPMIESLLLLPPSFAYLPKNKRLRSTMMVRGTRA